MIRDNDPCDEWPRGLILKAAGLLACGHPPAGRGYWCEACAIEARQAGGSASTLGNHIGGTVITSGRQIERHPGAE